MAMTSITWRGELVALHDLRYRLLMVSQETLLAKLGFSSELFSETVSFTSWSREQMLEPIIAGVRSEAPGSSPGAVGRAARKHKTERNKTVLKHFSCSMTLSFSLASA